MNGPGKILQQARKKKRYSIEKIHKITKIKKEFIEGLENDDVSVFPAELYYKNFLKTYAQFLSLDPEKTLELYETSKLDMQDDLFKQPTDGAENKFLIFYNKNKQIFIYAGYGILAVLLICLIIMIIPTKKNSQYTENSAIQQSDEIVSSKKELQTEQKLFIKAVSDTWLKIVGDNKTLYEDILARDNTIEATAKKEFTVKIGNIDGVEVYFNDKLIDISKDASSSKANTITLKRD